MKQKFFQSTPLLVSLVGIGFRYFADACMHSVGCSLRAPLWNIAFSVTNPEYSFFIWMLVVAVILIFVSQKIFISWLKFAAWFLPLAFIFIALTPVSSTRFGIDFFPYYRINAAHDAGVAFVAFSLLLIAWKYFSNYRTVKSLKS